MPYQVDTEVVSNVLRGRCVEDDGIGIRSEQSPRGEFTLVVGGCPPEAKPPWAVEQVIAALNAALASRQSASQIAREIAAQSGWSKKEIYKLHNKILPAKEEPR